MGHPHRGLGKAVISPTTEPHMPLYWLCHRHNNQISVVIEPAHSIIYARLRASIAGLDQGEFTEGHELDRESVARQFQRLGHVDDLMSVDTEGHLLVTRQLDDEFQLLAGRMHQLDSHFAVDLGNFSEIATQESKAQQVERSR